MTRPRLHRRTVLRQTSAWVVGVSGLLARSATAAVWMTPEQAMRLLIPDAQEWAPLKLSWNEQRLAQLEQLTDVRVPKTFAPQVWSALAQGHRIAWFMHDRVIGKYDWIDYALALDLQGAVLGLEVLAYRESHGGEIRQRHWRAQFIGRQGPQALRWGDDIRNISGSTLSCQHVTEGVQRLSALVRMLS